MSTTLIIALVVAAIVLLALFALGGQEAQDQETAKRGRRAPKRGPDRPTAR